jgi:hypothetical protein
MNNEKFNNMTRLTTVTAALLVLVAPAHAVDFGAFGNIRYLSSNQDAATQGFMLGGFDLYASHQIGDKTHVFVEYVMGGSGNAIVTDVERLSVSRSFNDKFTLAAGRFHTPIGYWNNIYHHGALLQDTAGRPSFLDFEDGANSILPTHTVGLAANGKFDTGRVQFSYDLAVGNGTSINTDNSVDTRELEVNNTGDPDKSKAIAARLGIEPENSGVKLGISTVLNHIPESGVGTLGVAHGGTLVAQKIFGLDAKFEMDRFDALAEVYRFSNNNKTGAAKKNSATAYFAQFGYRASERWKLVYRHENVSFDANDEYFNILGREQYRQHVLTLRMDVDDSNAVKLEINRQSNAVSADENRVIVQWEFLIP